VEALMLNPTGLKVALPGVKAKPGLGGKTRGNSAKSILDYAADVRAGDYYGARGEAESLAMGAGWADLGFAPDQQPTMQQLENLLNGLGPHGNQLARTRATEKTPEIRAGVDLTFSAPKSFSIMCAFASTVHKAELRAAQVAAIRDAVSWIEDEGYVLISTEICPGIFIEN
jgi:conjugative relaxase-like TrwC/TraI family protein